jgi:hypothetical protein
MKTLQFVIFNNIFKEGELVKDAVIRNFRITASDGKRYNY